MIDEKRDGLKMFELEVFEFMGKEVIWGFGGIKIREGGRGV